MTWNYVQKTGAVSHDGVHFTNGYSGNTDGFNNPAMQNVVGVGPVPCGTYRIGPPHQPIDHLGPEALPLVPGPENNMFGRSGFFIHGDNQAMNHTASNGCIILGPTFRKAIVESRDTTLVVVSDA
jgi:hypothetical protein